MYHRNVALPTTVVMHILAIIIAPSIRLTDKMLPGQCWPLMSQSVGSRHQPNVVSSSRHESMSLSAVWHNPDIIDWPSLFTTLRDISKISVLSGKSVKYPTYSRYSGINKKEEEEEDRRRSRRRGSRKRRISSSRSRSRSRSSRWRSKESRIECRNTRK